MAGQPYSTGGLSKRQLERHGDQLALRYGISKQNKGIYFHMAIAEGVQNTELALL